MSRPPPYRCGITTIISCGRCRRLRLGLLHLHSISPNHRRLVQRIGARRHWIIGGVLASVVTVHTGRQFPLTDQTLAAADRFIYFDWLTVLKLFDRFPQLDALLKGAYQSIHVQIILILVALALTQQLERLYRFLMATNMALLITCVVAVFLPALGPYELLNLTAADHPNISVITGAKMTEPILWIRAGVFGDPGPTIEVGLISFPSFHAATAAFTCGHLAHADHSMDQPRPQHADADRNAHSRQPLSC